jgi:hypothetical protein
MKFKFLRRIKQEPDRNVEFELALETSVRDLCGGDKELYDALEHFLLFNPKMILENMGNVPFWLARGDTAKSSGNNLIAAMDYEMAARIACYEEDKETTKNALSSAQSLNPNTEEAALDRILLSKLDKVFEISKVHYNTISKAEDEIGSSVETRILTAPIPKSQS